MDYLKPFKIYLTKRYVKSRKISMDTSIGYEYDDKTGLFTAGMPTLYDFNEYRCFGFYFVICPSYMNHCRWNGIHISKYHTNIRMKLKCFAFRHPKDVFNLCAEDENLFVYGYIDEKGIFTEYNPPKYLNYFSDNPDDLTGLIDYENRQIALDHLKKVLSENNNIRTRISEITRCSFSDS